MSAVLAALCVAVALAASAAAQTVTINHYTNTFGQAK